MGNNGRARLAATALAAVAGAAFLAMVIGHYLLVPGGPFDLAVYRAAGQAVLDGEPLYAPGFGAELAVGLQFTYAPIGALLSIPLALAPLGVDYVIWTAASLALLCGYVARASRQAALATTVGVPLLVVVACWTTPVTDVVLVGQVGIFLVFGCLWGATAKRPGAAALVGLFAAIKLTPLLFAAHFVLTRQWRRLGWMVLAVAVATGVAAVALPAATTEYFGSLLGDSSRIGDVTYYANQSILAVVARAGLGPAAWIAASAVTLALGLWLALAWHRRGEPIGGAVVVGIVTLLVSPISWQHHAVWIIPALLTAAPRLRGRVDVAIVGVVTALALLRIPSWAADASTGLVPQWILQLLMASGTISYLLLLCLMYRVRPRACVEGGQPVASAG